jgi:NTP pyrophosphatase (non-canonical NTP hydrolase)
MMNQREREILLILQEESAEVIQAVSKVFRFGYDSVWNHQSNKEHLEEEVGDFLAMIQIMVDIGMIDTFAIDIAKRNKIEKLKQWSNIFE